MNVRDQYSIERSGGSASVGLGIGVKDSDNRSAGYIAEYGNTCWEADILPEQARPGAMGPA